jgi:5-aminopentanamidase
LEDRLVRVGFFQFDPMFGEMAGNLDAVAAKLEQADADLIVLPELFASGYQFVSKEEVQRLAEPVPDGPTVRRLAEVAKRRRMHIVAGLPEQAGSRCYNSAIVVGPSGFLGCYRAGEDRRDDLLRLVLSGGRPLTGDAGGRHHLPSI